jgi:hypothetical protein
MSGGIVVLVAAPSAADNSEGPEPENNKISLCHRTNSESNPYVNRDGITPSKRGAIHGHDTHNEGPVWQPGFKDEGKRWGDIIPPFQWVDNKGVTQSYPGLNWTTEGQAIFNAGCKVKDEPPPPECPSDDPTLYRTSDNGKDADCVEDLAIPNVDQAECVNGQVTTPSFSKPPDSDHITYVVESSTSSGGVVRATIDSGWDFDTPLPAGWVIDPQNDRVARYTITFEVVTCPSTRTPAGINTSDPCGPNNVSWSAKPDDYFNYGVSEGMIRATLKAQYANDQVSGTTSWPLPVDSNTPCPDGPPPPPPSLTDVTPAVSFTDPDCDNLDGAGWVGAQEAVLDYEATGDAAAGETVIVQAVIEPGLTNKYEFAPGAQTRFTHTFDDVTLEDCVLGEETVVPKPKPEKPEPKPDKKPTVKGVQTVAPPAAAPTAVAAGLGGPTSSPLQTIAQLLVAGGMLLLVAGAWIGLGRRETGTHEA